MKLNTVLCTHLCHTAEWFFDAKVVNRTASKSSKTFETVFVKHFLYSAISSRYFSEIAKSDPIVFFSFSYFFIFSLSKKRFLLCNNSWVFICFIEQS